MTRPLRVTIYLSSLALVAIAAYQKGKQDAPPLLLIDPTPAPDSTLDSLRRSITWNDRGEMVITYQRRGGEEVVHGRGEEVINARGGDEVIDAR